MLKERLPKNAAKEIAKLFGAAGFKITYGWGFNSRTRRPKTGGGTVYVWDKTHKTCVVVIRWVPKQGWQVHANMPTLCFRADLDMLVDEISHLNQGVVEARAAFDAFRQRRTDHNWKTYQGVLAALYSRVIGQAGATV